MSATSARACINHACEVLQVVFMCVCVCVCVCVKIEQIHTLCECMWAQEESHIEFSFKNSAPA